MKLIYLAPRSISAKSAGKTGTGTWKNYSTHSLTKSPTGYVPEQGLTI
jgi:hypothetical protein